MYNESTYSGDETYNIDCTGDACVGDEVCFERATFTGSFRNAKFAGFEMISGKVIKDSYGAEKQQHTFTLKMEGGSSLRIKGRNLYKNGTYRKPWADESQRHAALDDKHHRGGAARLNRQTRREGNGYE